MKITKRLFCLAILTTSIHVVKATDPPVNVNEIHVDETFDVESLARLSSAIILLQSIYNSQEFEKEVKKAAFNVGNYDLDANQILGIIRSGMDNYTGKPTDYSIDLRLSVYDGYQGGDEFGVTNMTTRVTKHTDATYSKTTSNVMLHILHMNICMRLVFTILDTAEKKETAYLM